MEKHRKRSVRPKQGELPGVEGIKDKKLRALGDEFIELRDSKAELAKDMTACEAKIMDRMKELDLRVFVFGDQEMRITDGKKHVKVKTIKNEGQEEEEEQGESDSSGNGVPDEDTVPN